MNARCIVPIFCLILLSSSAGCDSASGDDQAQTPTSSTDESQENKGPEHELPAAPSAALGPGREVFVQVCARCHIESEYAPTIVDVREWKRRYARAEDGINTLYDHAANGFGEMLAKGGKRGKDLTDEQVRQAVDYAVAVTQADEPDTEQ